MDLYGFYVGNICVMKGVLKRDLRIRFGCFDLIGWILS